MENSKPEKITIIITGDYLSPLEIADMLAEYSIEELQEELILLEDDQITAYDKFHYDAAHLYEEIWYRVSHELYKRKYGTSTFNKN